MLIQKMVWYTIHCEVLRAFGAYLCNAMPHLKQKPAIFSQFFWSFCATALCFRHGVYAALWGFLQCLMTALPGILQNNLTFSSFSWMCGNLSRNSLQFVCRCCPISWMTVGPDPWQTTLWVDIAREIYFNDPKILCRVPISGYLPELEPFLHAWIP